jgi:uncharacterized RDD family membrane protein YckC
MNDRQSPNAEFGCFGHKLRVLDYTASQSTAKLRKSHQSIESRASRRDRIALRLGGELKSGDGSMATIPADRYSIGWWIESADDEIYGPASRATLVRFLGEGVISPNTLVRHCTEMTKRPVIDVPGVREGIPAGANLLSHGDKLSAAWPRRKKHRLALAQDSIPCVWKNQPAVLVCLRCGGPYCQKLQAKPFNRQFYFCRRCQAKLYNARAFAYIVDSFLLAGLLVLIPFVAIGIMIDSRILTQQQGGGLIYLFWFLNAIVFLFRDRIFGDAGPGKRLFGIHVVRSNDGQTPLGSGQAFIRWLSLMIPFFNLFDLSVPFRDPLMRRYGDRWAGTRVIDTDSRLTRLRQQIAYRLFNKKGVQLTNPVQTPLSEFARTAG